MGIENNIKLNIESPLGATGSAQPTGAQQSVGTVPMVQTRELSEEEKEKMLLLGYDPRNPEHVKEFLSKPPKDLDVLMDNAQISDTESQVTITKTTSSDVHSEHSEHDEHESEHVHNFKIDTESEEWKNMSPSQRLATAINVGASSQYPDGVWEKMDDKSKVDATKKFVENEFAAHVKGWDTMSDKEKLTQVINLLKIYTVADATKMTTKELWSMLKNEPDKFADLEEKTEKAIAQQKRKGERDSFWTSYDEYLNSKGLSRSPANEYKYLKDKIDNNKPLSSYEKDEYEALQGIREVNGGSLENIKAGNKTLEDLLEGDERIKRSEKNNKPSGKDNQELIVEYVRKGLEQCKSVEEKTRWLQQFDVRTQKNIVKSLMSAKQEKLGNETKNFLESISLQEGFDVIIMLALGKDTDKDNGVVAGNASKNIHKRLKKHGQSVEGLERHLKNNVIPVVHQDIAGHIGLAGAETGDKDFIGQINKAIANRDDAVDVFKVSNALIVNSNEVADEIKQFYAQNSIVVLNTQQERDAQAQDLTSYKNKSFDAGVASGLEIVSKSSDADSSYKTSSSSNTYVTESVTSTPQQTDSVRYASASPAVQDTSEKIILSNSSLSRDEAIKLFKEMTPQEQAELLISLPDNQLGKLPVELCENFPNLIPVFVNKGKGPDIISQCSNSGTITETIKCMQHGGSEIRKQLYALIADAPQFFAKSTQEWASNTIYANQDKADIPKKSINFRS